MQTSRLDVLQGLNRPPQYICSQDVYFNAKCAILVIYQTTSQLVFEVDSLVFKECLLDVMYSHSSCTLSLDFTTLLDTCGFHWDAISNTVTALDERCEAYLRVHAKVARFRSHSCPNYMILANTFN
ncbi:hypothetical protein CJ030_MR2G011737 [Morella rubra]|uniref:Uncharacterized protein n=1 Tax=Morella rubra TaxID=262757 RepID=A0A6A1WLB3_9ROSI|nr:hypothetical protein CJ030_MR2G011737 [Morella rubra]